MRPENLLFLHFKASEKACGIQGIHSLTLIVEGLLGTWPVMSSGGEQSRFGTCVWWPLGP